jgi:hypothetical protein
MQEQIPRFGLVRRFLLPYSGTEPLTAAQARRLIASWFVFFGCLLSIGTLPVTAALTTSLQSMLTAFLLTFLGSGTLFALMAGFVVYSINRTALYQQQLQKRQSTGTEQNQRR